MIFKFNEYLLERKQRGLLYHYTSLYGLYDILNKNQLKRNGRSGLVSLTRDKLFHRRDRLGVHTTVRITLDGDRLSDTYKIKPRTDFQGSKDPATYGFSFKKTECEEAINGSVNDAIRYIIALDIIPTNVKVEELERFDPKKFFNYPEDLHKAIGTDYTHKVKDGSWENTEPTPAAIKAFCDYMESKYGFPFGTLTDSQQDMRYRDYVPPAEDIAPLFTSENKNKNDL